MLRYFISREFLRTLLLMLGAGVLLYLLVFFLLLPAYARHGKGVTVPDVQQMSLQQAMDVLDDADLTPFLFDSTYVEGFPAGVVLKQYPEAYKRVKPYRSISLTINQRTPPMVSVPPIEDMILYQAKVSLEGRRLSLGKVILRPDLAENTVLEVSYLGKPVRAGDQVPVGAKIDVVVAKSSGTAKVPIPDLVGLSYEEALNLITSSMLQLGGISYNESGPADQLGRVFGQRPRATVGDSISVGAPIDLFVYGTEPTGNDAPMGEIVEEEVE